MKESLEEQGALTEEGEKDDLGYARKHCQRILYTCINMSV